MIDTPTHNNISDFRQRYQNVLGWFLTGKGEKLLVRVAEVGDSQVTFVDHGNNVYYANVGQGVNFEFLPVQRAWYDTELTTYYVSRKAARQWKRGICQENTSIEAIETILGIETPGKGLPWNLLAFNIFSTPQDTGKYVADFLGNKRSSCTLGRHFSLTKHLEGRVLFHNILVGYYSKNVITDVKPIIKQELTDVIRKFDLPFEIK